MQKGQIIRSLSGFYDIQSDQTVYRTRARGNFRKRKITPLVGDWVEFESTTLTEGYLLKILDRKNQLIRPPVSNVDQAIVIVSAVEPDFSTNLLDRVLIYLESLNVEAEIYLTKTDLLSDEKYAKLSEILGYYQSIGYQIYDNKDVFDPAQLKALTASFANKLSVFTGQTGAGKSTLLNHIDPALSLKTGEISQSLNRGKHTTRQVELIPVGDGLVADTPGFSSFGFLDITIDDLANLFVDFKHLSPLCRFRGCQHLKEPDCAVKERVESGEILKSRYTNYLQFRAELSHQRPTYQKKHRE